LTPLLSLLPSLPLYSLPSPLLTTSASCPPQMPVHRQQASHPKTQQPLQPLVRQQSCCCHSWLYSLLWLIVTLSHHHQRPPLIVAAAVIVAIVLGGCRNLSFEFFYPFQQFFLKSRFSNARLLIGFFSFVYFSARIWRHWPATAARFFGSARLTFFHISI
jgi:hypothetical protein